MPNNFINDIYDETNNLIDGSFTDKYFLKIAPDFSVFDVAEKNINDSQGLFYVGSNVSSITTKFRRAMFRIEKSGSSKPSITPKDSNFSYRVFEREDDYIVIAISTTDDPISFSIGFGSSKVVGVAF